VSGESAKRRAGGGLMRGVARKLGVGSRASRAEKDAQQPHVAAGDSPSVSHANSVAAMASASPAMTASATLDDDTQSSDESNSAPALLQPGEAGPSLPASAVTSPAAAPVARVVVEVQHTAASGGRALRLSHYAAFATNEVWGSVREHVRGVAVSCLDAPPAPGANDAELFALKCLSHAQKLAPLPADKERFSFDFSALVVQWTEAGAARWRRFAEDPANAEAGFAAKDEHDGLGRLGVVLDGPVEGFKAAAVAGAAAPASSSGRATLAACLDLFRVKEQLDDDNAWKCPRCKDFVPAFKQLELWSAPRTLVVHLKRFLYERSRFGDRMGGRKIAEAVDFPIDDFDLAPYLADRAVRGPVLYDLFAVSNHAGALGGGHYTAYVRLVDDEWYLADDSHVTKVDRAAVVTPEAYLLFYRRKD